MQKLYEIVKAIAKFNYLFSLSIHIWKVNNRENIIIIDIISAPRNRQIKGLSQKKYP